MSSAQKLGRAERFGPVPQDRFELGLIGLDISRSWAPLLHELAGEICGLSVRYQLIEPDGGGERDFADALRSCESRGIAGINVTHPFKELCAGLVTPAPTGIAREGAVNTVVFGPDGPIGHNTDHSGFIAAYRRRFERREPGVVALIGAGGVGRAIGHGLIALGAREIRVFDVEATRATALAEQLGAVPTPSVASAVEGADGIVNASPVGMAAHPGSPMPSAMLTGRRWCCDAVYTPMRTPFVTAATAAEVQVLGGFELFMQQGIDAFHLFTGHVVDGVLLRKVLLAKLELAETDLVR
jgi:shikimate dehydrogenase